MKRIRQIRPFSKSQDYDSFSVVRVSNANLKTWGRHTWVRIYNESNGARIVRRVKGAGNVTGLDSMSIEVDYDSLLDLGIKDSKPASCGDGYLECDLTVSKCSTQEVFLAHWNHIDPAYQFPVRLAAVSLVLGVWSIVLGILSLALAFKLR